MSGESQREPVNEPDPTVITTEIINKEITHLRELIETLLAERDLRYGERFDAQQVAVRAAFDGSEKAIQKAEVGIEKRADATYVNLQELSRSLSALMPRSEAESRLAALSEKVDAADKKADRIEAMKIGGTEQRSDLRLNVGTLLAVATMFLAIVVIAANFLAR